MHALVFVPVMSKEINVTRSHCLTNAWVAMIVTCVERRMIYKTLHVFILRVPPNDDELQWMHVVQEQSIIMQN